MLKGNKAPEIRLSPTQTPSQAATNRGRGMMTAAKKIKGWGGH